VIIVHARVKDIMTTRVVAVRSDASCRKMATLLRAHRVSGLPVVDAGGIVVGVVSESDLLTRRATAGSTAADLMTCPALTTGPDELVSSVARVMARRKLRRVPVVDRQGHLVGIVCQSDVLSVFSRPDEEIRREITQDVIMDGFFTDPDRLEVTVKDGIVTLGGAPGGVVLGRGIVEQVRHVEGVVAVRDRFSYPLADPASSPS
jgi:CBS domain-containing protein